MDIPMPPPARVCADPCPCEPAYIIAAKRPDAVNQRITELMRQLDLEYGHRPELRLDAAVKYHIGRLARAAGGLHYKPASLGEMWLYQYGCHAYEHPTATKTPAPLFPRHVDKRAELFGIQPPAHPAPVAPPPLFTDEQLLYLHRHFVSKDDLADDVSLRADERLDGGNWLWRLLRRQSSR